MPPAVEAGPARLVRSAQKDELYRGALKSRAGAVLSGLAGEVPPPFLLPEAVSQPLVLNWSFGLNKYIFICIIVIIICIIIIINTYLYV